MSKVSKIKINLASGNVIEKPLITCFKGTNGDYVILDGEANGQMGYPIVCISRFNENNFEKIVDPGEWGSVKENLKTIISGTALPYLSVPETVNAADDFYTQLTLPVASFDLLKSVYAPAPVQEAPAAPVAPAVPEAPVAPAAPAAPEVAPAVINPIAEPVTIANDASAPAPTPVFTPQFDINPAPIQEVGLGAPVIAESAPATPVAPAIETPVSAPTPEITPTPAAVTPEPMPATIAPAVETPVAPTPEVTPAPASSAMPSDIATIKESFMKSCETMFDALVKKFENK